MQSPATSSRARLARYKAFLAQDPDNPDLLVDAGELAIASGEMQTALDYFRHAASVQADAARVSSGLGLTLFALGKTADAIPPLTSALLGAPNDPGIRYALSACHADNGNFAGAWGTLASIAAAPAENTLQIEEEAFANVQRLAATLPRAGALGIRVLHHLGELEHAWTLAQALTGGDTTDADVQGAAAAICLDRNDSHSAVAFAKAALALNPAQSDALGVLGMDSLRNGRRLEARAAFDSAVAANDQSARAIAGIALIDLLEKRYESAEAGLLTARSQMPNHLGTWMALAWAQVALGKLGVAHDTLDQAMAINENFSETHGMLGLVALLEGRRDAARLAVRRALGLDRQSLSARLVQFLLARDTAASGRSGALLSAILETKLADGSSLHDGMMRLVTGSTSREAQSSSAKGT